MIYYIIKKSSVLQAMDKRYNKDYIDFGRLTESQFNKLVINSRYKDKYTSLINTVKQENRGLKKEKGYEIHHITPRAFGGKDTIDNKIKLTCKEHLMIHIYLTLITNNIHMYHAINVMFGKIFSNLSEVEKITVQEIDNFAKIRELSKLRLFSDDARETISTKAKSRWKTFKETGKINEVKQNISRNTSKGMKKSKNAMLKTRINLNSKWYYNPDLDIEMHWYEGDDIPDEKSWKPGRRPFKESTKNKLKNTLSVQKKKYYHNDELGINTTFNENDIIPPGWELGRKNEYLGKNKQYKKEKQIIRLETIKNMN